MKKLYYHFCTTYKTDELYIHWILIDPIIKVTQIEKLLKLTRANMNYKEYHKELKKKVNISEQVRNEDRSNKTWEDVRTLKKLKLQGQG